MGSSRHIVAAMRSPEWHRCSALLAYMLLQKKKLKEQVRLVQQERKKKVRPSKESAAVYRSAPWNSNI